MSDVHLIELAGRQFNRVARTQLLELGYSASAIEHRIDVGRLVAVEHGVYAVAPVLDDDGGRWMGATLTTAGSFLSHASAGAALGFWTARRDFETVTRPGSGGPVRHGGVLVCRSIVLEGDTAMLGPIPVTTAERTLLDLAAHVSQRALARAVREAVRLGATTIEQVAEALGRHRGRRGTARLGGVIARYTGLPLERARSGAEVRALEVLRDAGRPVPLLNHRVAGEEADLVWRPERLIVEIDGGPFHLDAGEDARRTAIWEQAGWEVRRIPSDDVHDHPENLLAVSPTR